MVERWILPDLASHLQRSRFETDANLYLLRSHERLCPDTLDPQSIVASLRNFANVQVSSGRLRAKLNKGEKRNFKQVPGDLMLKVVTGQEFVWSQVGIGRRPFITFDGEYSFLLHPQYHAHRKGLCASFSVLDKSAIKEYEERGIERDSLWENDIMIKQLQAVGKRFDSTLKEFRWERHLVGLVTEWAAVSGFPRILILPAAFSQSPVVVKSDWGHMRYDVTARRSGFRRDNENQAYQLSLV